MPHKLPFVILAWSLAAVACRAPTAARQTCAAPADGGGGIIVIAWRSAPTDSMCVFVRDAGVLASAREYIRTQTGPSILAGRVVRGAGVDPRVAFHYLPDSAALVDVAMEVCDSKLLRTAAEVDAYFQGATGAPASPSAPYCPWDARPVSVSPAG